MNNFSHWTIDKKFALLPSIRTRLQISNRIHNNVTFESILTITVKVNSLDAIVVVIPLDLVFALTTFLTRLAP